MQQQTLSGSGRQSAGKALGLLHGSASSSLAPDGREGTSWPNDLTHPVEELWEDLDQ